MEEHLGIEDVNDSIGVGKQLITCYVFNNLIKDDTRLEAKFITTFYDYERGISLQVSLLKPSHSESDLKLHSLSLFLMKNGLILQRLSADIKVVPSVSSRSIYSILPDRRCVTHPIVMPKS